MFFFVFLVACGNSAQKIVDRSGSSELRKFYDIAQKSNDKNVLRAASYIVKNMPYKYSVDDGGLGRYYAIFVDSVETTFAGAFSVETKLMRPDVEIESFKVSIIKDIDAVDSYTFIHDIILATDIWNSSPWHDKYSESVFYEYILPYRISNEPLEMNWREDANRRYRPLLDNLSIDDPKEVCIYIIRNINYKHYNIYWGVPLQRYSHNVSAAVGKCDDRCVYYAMIARSVGLPVAIDILPLWGDRNNGHSFNSLLLPDGTSVGFNAEYQDISHGIIMSGKVPKIYRKTFAIQKETSLFKNHTKEYIPSIFKDFDLMDVTAEYDLPVKEVSIPVIANYNGCKLGYLAVASRNKWDIIAWGDIHKEYITFRDVGYSYNAGQTVLEKGDDIGSGILYLPLVVDEGEMKYPINYPFILDDSDNYTYLRPDSSSLKSITITRKYPRLYRVRGFAERMVGCRIEGANYPDFRDAELLHTISTTPSSHMQSININEISKYKYLRIWKRRNGLTVGELSFYDKAGNQLSGKQIASKAIASEPTIPNVFDGDVLTYFHISGGLEYTWIGLELQTPTAVGRIEFCPRTDDNDITPGDEYELYYWDYKWISLGRRTATDYYLLYDNVPDNALLYVRNLTKGIEERPFTYDHKTNKQIWW